MDSNGFVRQKAVEILSQYPGQEGLRYILIRLADWVPQVRAAAENAIATLLVPERIKQWMAVIDSITWLQNVKRTDPSTAYNVITSFIAAQINLDEPYSNPPVYPESRWVTLFKWVLKHRNITWEQVRNWLWINDPRFYMDLLKNLGRFNSNEQMNLILFCLDQPDKRVRQTAMTYGRDFFAELEEWYWKGLCDNNAYIRLYCRDVLKDKIPDACGYYRKLVKEGRQLPGSLCGLIELGNDKELPLYKELLSHPNQKVRATALFGVAKFDYDAAIIPARSSLFDLNGTMRKAAVSVFLKNTDLLSFRELYQTFHENAIENRRTMLQMATRKSGWIAIPFCFSVYAIKMNNFNN
ncbi:MAG: hypothetical protein NVV59_17670 [Chitinophagaceae bacterium]|nr:hypothetical protein [Chitinophagaceae bacterium]